MKKYYLLEGVEGKKSEPTAGAFAPKGVSFSYLLNEGILENVRELPHKLSMMKLTVSSKGIIRSDDLTGVKDVWLDFPPSNLSFSIMSQKMRDIITTHLSGDEGIDWIKCRILANDEEREYFVLCFKTIPDVLDQERTLFIDGTNRVIKPVFSYEKVKKLAIFTKPSEHDFWKLPTALYVSEELKIALEKESITGVAFSKVPVY